MQFNKANIHWALMGARDVAAWEEVPGTHPLPPAAQSHIDRCKRQHGTRALVQEGTRYKGSQETVLSSVWGSSVRLERIDILTSGREAGGGSVWSPPCLRLLDGLTE